MTDRILDGFWTWVGEHIIGFEGGRYVAVHQTGRSVITTKGDDRTDADRVRELVDRCTPKARP